MVRIPAPGPEPVWHSVLAVDAMYFHAARQVRKRSERCAPAIERAERRVWVHQSKIDAMNAAFNEDEIDSSTHYSRLEPLAIQMENVEYGVGEAYGILLENVATVHMLCAASLEAHINARAEQLLSTRAWSAFEHLALDATCLSA